MPDIGGLPRGRVSSRGNSMETTANSHFYSEIAVIPRASAAPTPPASTEVRPTVWIVDDDAAITAMLSRMIESLGFQLVCALAEQLEGNLQVSRRRGASVQLTFAAEE